MNTRQAWAIGGTVLAATLMLIIGIFQIFQGIAAIVQNNFFVLGPNYAYEIDTAAWGWIHLAIGIIVAITGVALFTGALWARVVGIGVAVISATANFFFLPYYPLWALLIIALDVFVIWAITSVRTGYVDEVTMVQPSAYPGAMEQPAQRWPAANPPTGRHWSTEPAKEGTGIQPPTGTPTSEEAAQQARQAADQASRRTPS